MVAEAKMPGGGGSGAENNTPGFGHRPDQVLREKLENVTSCKVRRKFLAEQQILWGVGLWDTSITMLNLDGAPLPLQAVVGIGIALSLGELGSIISSVSGGGAGTTSPAEIQNNPGQKDTPMMARAHPETEDGSGTATLGKKRKVSIREGDGNEGGGIEVEMSNKKPKVLIDGERLLEEFTCPISLGLPIDPVIAEDGR